MLFSSDSYTKVLFLVSLASRFRDIMPKTFNVGNGDSADRRETMKALLSSMEKAVFFYSENIEKVNLDSVFGLRVGQGSLKRQIVFLVCIISLPCCLNGIRL